MFGQPICRDKSEGSYPLYASLLRTSALEKSYFRISSFSNVFALYGDISHGFNEVRDIFTLIYACVCRGERRLCVNCKRCRYCESTNVLVKNESDKKKCEN